MDDSNDVPVEVRAYQKVSEFVSQKLGVILSMLDIRRTEEGLKVSAFEFGGKQIRMREKLARRIINMISKVLGFADELISGVILDQTLESVECICNNGSTAT